MAALLAACSQGGAEVHRHSCDVRDIEVWPQEEPVLPPVLRSHAARCALAADAVVFGRPHGIYTRANGEREPYRFSLTHSMGVELEDARADSDPGLGSLTTIEVRCPDTDCNGLAHALVDHALTTFTVRYDARDRVYRTIDGCEALTPEELAPWTAGRVAEPEARAESEEVQRLEDAFAGVTDDESWRAALSTLRAALRSASPATRLAVTKALTNTEPTCVRVAVRFTGGFENSPAYVEPPVSWLVELGLQVMSGEASCPELHTDPGSEDVQRNAGLCAGRWRRVLERSP